MNSDRNIKTLPNAPADLEGRLLDRLEALQKEFCKAATQYQHLMDVTKGLGLVHADGSTAIDKAQRIHQRAFSRVRRALHDYQDFVEKRVIPTDPADAF